MECNKEEAIRAKEIAERKMEKKDFLGARKIALKAQQLYPELDNISQMILVCDVHCSAETTLFGNDRDWYAILKIDPSADETAIRKQYRKLALLLHPDKNRFAGAADAFKLIGDAQMVLLDRGKRMLFDNKRKAAGRSQVSNSRTQQPNRQSNFWRPPWVQNSFANNISSQFQNQQKPQPQQTNLQQPQPNRPTFWTTCPFCSVRYQYYKDVINRRLNCQSCGKSFTGYETNVPPGSNRNQPAFPQQKDSKSQVHYKVNQESAPGSSSSKMTFHRNVGNEKPASKSSDKTGEASIGVEGSKANRKNRGEVDPKINKRSQPTDSRRRKKRKKVSESSESCDVGNSVDSEEDMILEEDGDSLGVKNFENHGKQYPRRSTRSKQHVSYSENISDDDVEVVNASKKSKVEAPKNAASVTAQVVEDEAGVKGKESSFKDSSKNSDAEAPKENGKCFAPVDDEKNDAKAHLHPSDSSPSPSRQPDIYVYPDPEFYDFDDDRKTECFKVGQIWGLYDTLDAMPRFYARIKKVFSPGFKLTITWLEPQPDGDDENKWVDEGLPVSCGRFRLGHTETTEDLLMFSHLIHWQQGNRRDTFNIYPFQGEIWALFKNWKINWYTDPSSHQKYDYEFVEVLSDYAPDSGVQVAFLSKIRGFACLFGRTKEEGKDSVFIPANEIFRFSHRVPSFRMTGNERPKVPSGSFELDPASLPANFEGTGSDRETGQRSQVDTGGPEASLERSAASGAQIRMQANSGQDELLKPCPAEAGETKLGSSRTLSCTFPMDRKLTGTSAAGHVDISSDSNTSNNGTRGCNDAPASTPEVIVIPDPEFYNFDDDKNSSKFQVGQVWALYSDEDGLPKYYAQIKKVDTSPEFAVHVTWLVPCPQQRGLIRWSDKNMLLTCGIFKPRRETAKYSETGSFSHQVIVEGSQRDGYAIFPQQAEVWALYKNWSPAMTIDDLENCDYEIVEILEVNDQWVSGQVLKLLRGYKSVFKPAEGRNTRVQIPRSQLLKFSHRVPAFRLGDQKGGSLRGFWELDTAAVPLRLLSSS